MSKDNDFLRGTQRTDLNAIVGEKAHEGIFPDKVFTRLPGLLGDAAAILTEKREKEVFLVSALAVISGILPNVCGRYMGTTVYPNLYSYVIGKYGAGKGAMQWARYLAEGVQRYKVEQYQAERQEAADMGDEAEPAARKMLFIPANSSRTGVYELLDHNDGEGVIFESEADTLAETLKADFGNFSDGLRKGFHHETISYYRRGGKEFVDLHKPRLSLVLSSTFDQLQNLLPSPENGLFSRIMFYVLESETRWINPFDERRNNYEDRFTDIGVKLLELYQLMEEAPPKYFRLTADQVDQFNGHFSQTKLESIEDVGEEFMGTVHRLGLIAYRIAMIFSTLRAYRAGDLLVSEELTCADDDFANAIEIVTQLTEQAVDVYSYLDRNRKEKALPLNKRMLIANLPAVFTRSEGLKYLQDCDISPRTYDRMLRDPALFECVKKGTYRKVGRTRNRDGEDIALPAFSKPKPPDQRHQYTAEEIEENKKKFYA